MNDKGTYYSMFTAMEKQKNLVYNIEKLKRGCCINIILIQSKK